MLTKFWLKHWEKLFKFATLKSTLLAMSTPNLDLNEVGKQFVKFIRIVTNRGGSDANSNVYN